MSLPEQGWGQIKGGWRLGAKGWGRKREERNPLAPASSLQPPAACAISVEQHHRLASPLTFFGAARSTGAATEAGLFVGSVSSAVPPDAASGRRKPATDLRSCAESSASLPTELDVAVEFSVVCALISRSTCMLRAMLCAAEACCRELAEMFCTKLAIWFDTCSISSSAAPAFSASSAPPTTSVVLRSIETTASFVSA